MCHPFVEIKGTVFSPLLQAPEYESVRFFRDVIGAETGTCREEVCVPGTIGEVEGDGVIEAGVALHLLQRLACEDVDLCLGGWAECDEQYHRAQETAQEPVSESVLRTLCY